MRHIFFHKLTVESAYRALVLLIVILIVLIGANILHNPDPTWALISAVICTD